MTALFRSPFSDSERETLEQSCISIVIQQKGVAKLHDTHHLPPAAPVTAKREERGQRSRGGKTAALHPDKPKPKLLASWLP